MGKRKQYASETRITLDLDWHGVIMVVYVDLPQEALEGLEMLEAWASYERGTVVTHYQNKNFPTEPLDNQIEVE